MSSQAQIRQALMIIMGRICYMLLAAAFLAAGCTKDIGNGPIEELEIGIADTDTKVSLGSYNVVAEDYQ